MSARAPRPCTWGARWRKSQRWNARAGGASCRSGCSCSSPSRRRSTRTGRPPANMWGGRTRTFPTAGPGDATAAVEAQIERFAPGFGDVVLARCARGPRELERDNPNLVGDDINGGAQDLAQLFSHPAGLLDPYATPVPGLFLCSSSPPPGGGVHGMCGWHAARSALRRVFGRRLPRRPERLNTARAKLLGHGGCP